MCDFISWKEYKGNVYFLQNSDLTSKIFNAYKKYNKKWRDDIYGHGAIEYFYPELKGKGVNKECEDFSKLSNFPEEIVDAVKQYKLTRIGYSIELLNNNGKNEYNKIRESAYAEYREIWESAWAEYDKIREEYNKIRQTALAECNKITQTAWEEYKKIEQPAWEEYNKITQTAMWKLFKNKKYRNKAWL